MIKLNKEDYGRLLKDMLRIRRFEEKVLQCASEGRLRASTHSYIGQEAIAAGTCLALRENDLIASTHRGHGHCIARGGRLDMMMAELLGRKTGYCKGKGGSMHIADLDIGILAANGIVGGGIPLGTGAALSASLFKTGQVVVSYFGDGAANQGCLYESMNVASLWKLPILFVCENNLYGMTVSIDRALAGGSIVQRAIGFGLPGVVVDGNDCIEVYKVISQAEERARAGQGPALIEAKTYRWRGHWQGDPRMYRTREEEEAWRKKCPIERLERYLVENSICTQQEIERIKQDVIQEVEEAARFALESPEPEENELLQDIYVEGGCRT